MCVCFVSLLRECCRQHFSLEHVIASTRGSTPGDGKNSQSIIVSSVCLGTFAPDGDHSLEHRDTFTFFHMGTSFKLRRIPAFSSEKIGSLLF